MGGLTYIDFLAKFGVGGAHPGGIGLTKSILAEENITNECTILDAGCGTGQTAAYLFDQYKAKITCLELNPIMIEKAKNRFLSLQYPIQLIQGSVEEIPFQDDSFDFILCESVLAFVNKPKALKEFNRVLKPGGRLLANEMTINSKLNKQAEEEIVQFYNIDSLLLESDWVQLFEECGFTDIEIKSLHLNLMDNSSAQEFNFSQNFEPELFSILNQHGNMLVKYHDILSHRIFSCSK
ncbi:class I SAM-dependent methyltransferase [Neobacillus kokaensis]|uniref:Methyltransferase n=1 Tax=Neobacillus kokaensis TaxID=2759023 RepID=A0ABQ3NA55_9BACI|nr:class I SAM-dependent methyltransferase [Neobacillus kokaensis]GHI00958.1 methyltransferase [Neobacillus kokaensis]